MLQPRYYQTAANEAVWKYFSEKSGNCVVVLPTGAGKSLLIAMLIQQALDFGGRVVVLAHRKELLQQNADEIRGMIPGVDVGVYSAGLKKREIHNAVVVAGIQSVFRKADDLGRRHLILVDEAHLISDLEESMYRRFLGDMQKQEGLRIAGLTATPFRTGTGPICGPDRIFQRIVFESKTSELIQQGFLCPITNKVATSEVNTDSVPLKGGEFVDAEIQAVFGAEDVVKAACLEICDKAHDRHSILVFASGVAHAEQIAEILPGSAVVTGETMPIERAETLRRFEAGELRFLINVDVLTTGFNARNIDAIAILRATMSPGLFCQMVGRGLRLHDSCTNCLLLDFGGNIARHGSIDDENFGASKEQSNGRRGEVAAQNGRGKKCPACELDVAANARSCPECEFIFPVKHEAKADDESQVTGAMPPEEWIVKDVVFRVHVPKRDADAVVTPSVRVDYVVSKTDEGGNLANTTIAEWICPQHSGFARNKFLAWWDAHSICDPPDNSADCVELMKLGTCRWPGGIVTKKKGQWFEILEHKWASEKPTTLAEIVEEREFSGVGDDCPF